MDNHHQLQESYERLIEARRQKLYNYYLKYWVFIGLFSLIYWATLSLLLASSNMKSCGFSLTNFLLCEWIVTIVFPIYLGIMLCFAKKSMIMMRIYQKQVLPLVILFSIWGWIDMFMFMTSIEDWLSSDLFIGVAGMLWGIKGIVYSVILSFAIWVRLLNKCVNPTQSSAVADSDKIKEKECILKWLSLLQKLKAQEHSFNSSEDIWWICMQSMKLDEEIIALPCHEKHCMHYEWISEWYVNHQSCPMCKTMITLDMIQKRLEDANQGLIASDRQVDYGATLQVVDLEQ